MQVKAFNGLNNVGDPLNLGLSWLVRADNIHITAVGRMEKRRGYSKYLAAVVPPEGAYTTVDYQRGYYVDAGSLKTFEGAVLRAGLAMATMHWSEVNGQVFFTNGIDSGIILPDNSVIPWAWPVPTAPTLRAVTGDLAPGLYRACCTYTLPDGREVKRNAPSARIRTPTATSTSLRSTPPSRGLSPSATRTDSSLMRRAGQRSRAQTDKPPAHCANPAPTPTRALRPERHSPLPGPPQTRTATAP